MGSSDASRRQHGHSVVQLIHSSPHTVVDVGGGSGGGGGRTSITAAITRQPRTRAVVYIALEVEFSTR